MGKILRYSSQACQHHSSAALSARNISLIFKAGNFTAWLLGRQYDTVLPGGRQREIVFSFIGSGTDYWPPLTYVDMTFITADIKNTLSATITGLKVDLSVLTEKLASIEWVGKQRVRAILQLEQTASPHSHEHTYRGFRQTGKRHPWGNALRSNQASFAGSIQWPVGETWALTSWVC